MHTGTFMHGDRAFLKRHDKVRLSPKYQSRELGAAHSDRGEVVRTDYESDKPILVRRDGVKTAKWYAAGIWLRVDENKEALDVGAQLLEGCRLHIKEPGPKLIYADWLTEQGLTSFAAAWRWMAKTGRYPEFRHGEMVKKRWRWWFTDSIYDMNVQNTVPTPVQSRLPGSLAVHVCPGGISHYQNLFLASAEPSAVGALAAALVMAKQEVDLAYT